MTNQLFPPFSEREPLLQNLNALLVEAQQRVQRGAVTPTYDRDAFQAQLAKIDFAEPHSLSSLLHWAVAALETGLVHVTHPRYFGLFNPTPTFPAQLADMITAAFNPQLATGTTSPVAVAIERHVMQAFATQVGLPPGATGHFTTGGSEANYTALLLALTRANADFRQRGARAFSGQPRFYVSKDSHLAWLKIAQQAGIGREAAVLVATDGHGRLDYYELFEHIVADRRNGAEPVMIAATAGTTNAGMVDPLLICADMARSLDLWLHVDAAWAGACIASPIYRSALAGIESADTVTIDAHKWLATTMGCGMFLTRHRAVLTEAFHTDANFMPSADRDVDPYVSSVQWSRRFLGLRLFLALAAGGWAGYAEHVHHSIELCQLLAARLQAVGWRIVNDFGGAAQALGVVCCLPPDDQPVRPLVARVLTSGRAWVSVALFEGQEVVRACVTSGLTTADDVQVLIDTLVSASRGEKQ